MTPAALIAGKHVKDDFVDIAHNTFLVHEEAYSLWVDKSRWAGVKTKAFAHWECLCPCVCVSVCVRQSMNRKPTNNESSPPHTLIALMIRSLAYRTQLCLLAVLALRVSRR